MTRTDDKATARLARATLSGLLCLSLAVWSLLPSIGHTPMIIETIKDRVEMVTEHGCFHGFIEDLFWAMHDHLHDGADHDHGQVVLLPAQHRLSLASPLGERRRRFARYQPS